MLRTSPSNLASSSQAAWEENSLGESELSARGFRRQKSTDQFLEPHQLQRLSGLLNTYLCEHTITPEIERELIQNFYSISPPCKVLIRQRFFHHTNTSLEDVLRQKLTPRAATLAISLLSNSLNDLPQEDLLVLYSPRFLFNSNNILQLLEHVRPDVLSTALEQLNKRYELSVSEFIESTFANKDERDLVHYYIKASRLEDGEIAGHFKKAYLIFQAANSPARAWKINVLTIIHDQNREGLLAIKTAFDSLYPTGLLGHLSNRLRAESAHPLWSELTVYALTGIVDNSDAAREYAAIVCRLAQLDRTVRPYLRYVIEDIMKDPEQGSPCFAEISDAYSRRFKKRFLCFPTQRPRSLEDDLSRSEFSFISQQLKLATQGVSANNPRAVAHKIREAIVGRRYGTVCKILENTDTARVAEKYALYFGDDEEENNALYNDLKQAFGEYQEHEKHVKTRACRLATGGPLSAAEQAYYDLREAPEALPGLISPMAAGDKQRLMIQYGELVGVPVDSNQTFNPLIEDMGRLLKPKLAKQILPLLSIAFDEAVDVLAIPNAAILEPASMPGHSISAINSEAAFSELANSLRRGKNSLFRVLENWNAVDVQAVDAYCTTRYGRHLRDWIEDHWALPHQPRLWRLRLRYALKGIRDNPKVSCFYCATALVINSTREKQKMREDTIHILTTLLSPTLTFFDINSIAQQRYQFRPNDLQDRLSSKLADQHRPLIELSRIGVALNSAKAKAVLLHYAVKHRCKSTVLELFGDPSLAEVKKWYAVRYGAHETDAFAARRYLEEKMGTNALDT